MSKPKSHRLSLGLPVAAMVLFMAAPIHAKDNVPVKHLLKSTQVSFNWFANGAKNPSIAKAKAALVAVRVINGPGRWVCSPAGFGRRSTCYAS